MAIEQSEIFKAAMSDYETLEKMRHDLHRHPETAFEERRTAQVAARALQESGIDVTQGLAKTGVVGRLSCGSAKRAIGLRADMDALHMDEANDFAHRSTIAGKMHGCGHDGHTVMLLGAARQLAARKNFDGTVYFIFQPAEENEGGGRAMIEDGLFDRFDMEAVFGLHNIPGIPLGHFAVKEGAMMAGFDVFEISLAGKGGHAAMPDKTADPIIAMAALIAALQSIISRNIDPMQSAVLSITTAQAGTTTNVIPESAKISGTVRYFEPKVQDVLEKRLREIARHVGEAHGVRAEVVYERRYPSTINAPAQSAYCADLLARLLGEQRVNRAPAPLMAAEDFAFMLEKKPGCYVWAGNGDEPGSCMVHNPKYDFNDKLIPYGVTYWVELAERYLRAA